MARQLGPVVRPMAVAAAQRSLQQVPQGLQAVQVRPQALAVAPPVLPQPESPGQVQLVCRFWRPRLPWLRAPEHL